MSDAKHTPTLALPLRASTTHSCEVHIFDRNDEKVASIVSYTGDLTTAQLDNADLIVAACNSHDALVAALAQMVAVFDHPKLSTPADRAMARIAGHAALKAAKEEA